MNKILAAALVSTLAVSAFAGEKAAKKESFKLIRVADLAAGLKSPQPPAVFDANGDETRAEFGVIPGAVLLASPKKYDVKKVLPSDKNKAVVFYCGSTLCMASHVAAERAVKAGYKDVSVMSDGIKGWKDAGQPVAQPAK